MESAQLTTALSDRYRIDREIGRGGMATVYRARDLKHDRWVALKVLDPELGAVLGVERFLAEIKVTANLQHPNLLPLFDSGEADGLLFYVMPFVEGESLRARLDREKQLPIEEAVHIATAVASALDYAHRHGVIHRDLKPENILLHEGQPLVADFGIALAVSRAGGQRITQTGLSLGTPQYMSPEQATGDRQIDGRTDIYSLGAMLYEMLTGEPPHSGTTAQAIIAKVLTDKPRSIRLTRDMVPSNVEAAVDRALAKLPADRWATAHDFAAALQGTRDGVSTPVPATLGGRPRLALRGMRRPEVLASWVLTAIAIVVAAWALLRPHPAPETPVIRVGLELPPGERVLGFPGTIAIAPAGDLFAYTSITSASSMHTVVRRANELTGRVMAASDLGDIAWANMAFSPDGRWLAYTYRNEIRKVLLNGGSSISLGSLPGGTQIQGMSWATPDSIVIGSANGLWTIPARGGASRPVQGADSALTATAPVVLPDQQMIAYTSGVAVDDRRLTIRSLATGTRTVLDVPAVSALGFREGHLLYVTPNGTLMALPFDLRRWRVTGDPTPIQDSVEAVHSAGAGGAMATLSASGTLAYISGSSENQLILVGSGGLEHALTPEARKYSYPRYSPDGRKIAVAVQGATSDIWVFDLAAHTFTRLTTEGNNTVPEWSGDGRRILYRSEDPRGRRSILWIPADGSAKPELLQQPDEQFNEAVLSPDDKWLIYRAAPAPHDSRAIFVVPLSGDRKARLFVGGPGGRFMPRVSPDGAWLAYAASESGRNEIYVQPFPNGGARIQVSDQGGSEPLWARSGRTLFYRSPAGIVAVSVTTGKSFSIGERRIMATGDYLTDVTHANWDVAPDGVHFLMLKQSGADARPIIAYNWGRELHEKLAAGRR